MPYTDDQLMAFRRLINDDTLPYKYDDATLTEWLDAAEGDQRKAASNFWYMKATTHAESVDISEAGSSRKNSDLFKNAMALAKQYDDSDAIPEDLVAPSTTRRIVRW